MIKNFPAQDLMTMEAADKGLKEKSKEIVNGVVMEALSKLENVALSKSRTERELNNYNSQPENEHQIEPVLISEEGSGVSENVELKSGESVNSNELQTTPRKMVNNDSSLEESSMPFLRTNIIAIENCAKVKDACEVMREDNALGLQTVDLNILNQHEDEKSPKIIHQSVEDKNYRLEKARKIDGILELSNLDPKAYKDEDTTCGIWFFKPTFLQKWATPRCYLVLYSIIGVLQGSYYSYFSGCMSTVEKRFAFNSQISGYIMMSAEITPICIGIPIGIWSAKSHMPRIIAFGMFVTVISCFLPVLPYFIYGPAQHLNALDTNQNETGFEICDGSSKIEMCDKDDRPPTITAVALFMLGSCLEGFGGMTYYVVGTVYMDNNTKKKSTPFYFAVAFSLRLFGPTLGYFMSSFFLNINEDPFVDPGYGPEDPRWIGGWWMGYMFLGFLLLFFTVPIAMFPRRLTNQRHLPKPHYEKDENWRQKFAGLFQVFKRLYKNPLYLVLILNTILSALGSFGHYMMLPKYMENQFRLTASEASLYSGPPGLIAIQVATLLGGFLIWKYRPSSKLLTAGMALSELFLAVGFLILMIPKCDNVKLSNVGLTEHGLSLDNQCNENCLCTTAAFSPVCGPDKATTFFNPCYAGCKQAITVKEKEEFYNCSCVTDVSGNFVNAPALVKGHCVVENCWSQALAYIIILPTFCGITSILMVAQTMVLLRCIDPADKSVAMGVFHTLTCLLGFIPYPILFGALADSVCLVWEKSCGQTGNCWFYDMDKFSYMIHGVSTTFSTLSGLCMLAAYFLRSRLHDLYEDEDPDSNVSIKSCRKEGTDSSANAVTKM